MAIAAVIGSLTQSSFAAKPSLESAPPVVVKTIPAAGATDVDPALTEIRVTFSKPMQEGKGTGSAWGKENLPESGGQPRYQDKCRTCVLPVKLEPDKSYALWLNTDKVRDFKDTGGRPAVPYLLTFSTSSGSDHREARAKGYEYTVQPGDTLSLIAESFRAKGLQIKVDQIVEANPDLVPTRLKVGQKLLIPATANPPSAGGDERMKALVEDFFAHNYRDITARDTLEWGPMGTDEKGNSTIRYRYRAKIWDKDTVTNNQVFTFDPHGKFVSVRDLYGNPRERMMRLVERFFDNNYRDITARETIEWGDGVTADNGNTSIRYKYRAKIRDGDIVVNNQVFTFDSQDKFVSVEDVLAAMDPQAVRTYTVSRKVSDFPTNEDLSTPESAYAVFNRAWAAGDEAIWGRLSIESIARHFPTNAPSRKMSAEAVAESLNAEVLEVNIYRDTFALVFAKVPGAVKSSIDIRHLELENGRWLNAGNDVVDSLEAARKLFERRCAQRDARRESSDAPRQQRSPVPAEPGPDSLLNNDQRAVLAWTDRQFRSFFDARTFEGSSDQERADLEARLLDAVRGPRTREYYQAINTLAALRSTNALPRLREIAFERVDRDNRDRWMAIRALGIIGDKSAVPDLIHLVYHGNPNTHWWAQISLVRLTGQNFGGDWNAWGEWWNKQGGQPPYNREIIRWWSGQAEPDKLAQGLEEGDRKFLESIQPK
jgi:RNA polymerase sigma-70 factor (ECF subfamily)